MHKVKKLICTLLAVCIISTTLAQPVQAFTGAEGAILGGGGALASISLTAPQVALLVAAGFGIVVAVENADKLAEGMTAALNTAAAGVDAGAETLAQWLETAKKGSIAIAGAPAWIAAAIKGWISGLYDTVHNPPISYVQNVSKGSTVPAVDFWGTSTYTVPFDGVMVRVGESEKIGSSIRSLSYIFIFRDYNLSRPEKYDGVCGGYAAGVDGYYYYKRIAWGANISLDTTSDYELKALDACKALPSFRKIRDQYLETVNPGSGWTEQDAVLFGLNRGIIDTPSGSICPDNTVGGINSALEQGKSIDDVNMPDLDVAGSKSICPDGVLDGSIPIADTVADVILGLRDGTMTWTDFVSDVAVGTPTISVPVEGTQTGVIDYPITDTGISDVPIEDTPDKPGEVEIPEGLAPYTVQLKDFFPFCIPFDIVDFVGVLCADPVAPSFEWTFTQYSGQKDTLQIDLAPFDEVAQLLRNMELLLFIIGLAFLTRNLIRG